MKEPFDISKYPLSVREDVQRLLVFLKKKTTSRVSIEEAWECFQESADALKRAFFRRAIPYEVMRRTHNIDVPLSISRNASEEEALDFFQRWTRATFYSSVWRKDLFRDTMPAGVALAILLYARVNTIYPFNKDFSGEDFISYGRKILRLIPFYGRENKHNARTGLKIEKLRIHIPQEVRVEDFVPYVMAEIMVKEAPAPEKERESLKNLEKLLRKIETIPENVFADGITAIKYINQNISVFQHAHEIEDFGISSDDYSKIYFKVRGCSSNITINANTKRSNIFSLLEKEIITARRKETPVGGIARYKSVF